MNSLAAKELKSKRKKLSDIELGKMFGYDGKRFKRGQWHSGHK